MIITEMLNVNNVTTELKGNTKEEILRELVGLVRNGEISDEEKFFQDILKREDVGSTALENGLAIPHVRSEYIKHFKIGVGIKKEGIDFESIDGEKTRLFVIIATPMKHNNWHLEALAKISSILYNKVNIDVIVNSSSKEGVIKLISELERNR